MSDVHKNTHNAERERERDQLLFSSGEGASFSLPLLAQHTRMSQRGRRKLGRGGREREGLAWDRQGTTPHIIIWKSPLFPPTAEEGRQENESKMAQSKNDLLPSSEFGSLSLSLSRSHSSRGR